MTTRSAKIDHVDGVTLTDAEHYARHPVVAEHGEGALQHPGPSGRTTARLWGHIIIHGRALSFNGLANAQLISAINAGAHASPAFAGDTVYAWSEVLDKSRTSAPGVRCTAVAVGRHQDRDESMTLRGDDGKYAPGFSGP